MYEFEAQLPETNMVLVVRPNDLDSLGHVNNAVSLEYFETGRWDWLRQNNFEDGKKVLAVVTRTEINYRKEILPGEIHIITTLAEKGAFSVKFKQRVEVRDGNGSQVAVDAIIQVGFIDAEERSITGVEDFFEQYS